MPMKKVTLTVAGALKVLATIIFAATAKAAFAFNDVVVVVPPRPSTTTNAQLQFSCAVGSADTVIIDNVDVSVAQGKVTLTVSRCPIVNIISASYSGTVDIRRLPAGH
jgi:hypothetical protein